MSNVFHKNFTLDENHAVTTRLYADVAARDADTAFQVTANINKFVKVTSPDSYYILSSIGPSVWVEMSSTGFNEFIELIDTPSSYSGQAGKVVEVNAGETALEFGQILTALGLPTFAQLTVDNIRLDANTISTLAFDLILNPAESVEILASQLSLTNTAGDAVLILTAVGVQADPIIRFELVDNIPSFTMGVDDSEGDTFKIGTTGLEVNTFFEIDPAANGDITLDPNGTGQLVIPAQITANNIGIGTSVVHNLLDVHSSTAEAAIAITSLGTDTDPLIKFELVDNVALFTMGIDDSDVDKFKIGTTALDVNTSLTIDGFGNFGFGTSGPTVRGHFMGTSNGSAEVLISTDVNDAGQRATLAFTIPNQTPRSGMYGTTRTGDITDLVLFAQSGTSTEFDAVTILGASGNVGVGVSPTDKLHVNGSIRTTAGIGAVLKLGSQNGTNEGAEIDWDGAGSNDDWTQDVFFQKMRFFTSSSSFNIVEFNNAGSGTMNLTVEDMIGLGSLDNPLHNLDVRGTTGLELTESAVNVNSGKQTIIGITDTAAVRTVTLRTVDTVLRRVYIIKDQSFNAGTNKISVVTEGGQKIDNDLGGIDIIVDGGKLRVYCNGTDWFSW